jgi:hypothetical protein
MNRLLARIHHWLALAPPPRRREGMTQAEAEPLCRAFRLRCFARNR